MREDIAKIVKEKVVTKELGQLLQECKNKVKQSRDDMAKFYDDWDFADQIYRGKRKLDETDKKAIKRKEPAKMILPMTKSQVETFVAFGTRLLTQRKYFYELVPQSDEDVTPSRMAMATLERDLGYNKYKEILLPAFLRSIAKYGVGVMKETWWHDRKEVKSLVPDPSFVQDPNLDLMEPPMVEQVEVKTKYLGNKIVQVSPYKFFPDTSLPLTRFQEGEFCASEEEQSFAALEQMEQDGVTAGIEHVRRTTDGDIDRRMNFAVKGLKDGAAPTGKENARYGVLTEIVINCIPSKTMIAPGVALDKDLNRVTKCLIWYVNDDRIVRIEPDMGYEHEEFPYAVAQYNNDGEQLINGGLAEDIGALQETSTWFVNSHVTSVRKVIDNRLLVDPKFIEMQDLYDRKTVIRTKPGASSNGIQQWFQQLQVQDVTSNHMKDVEFMNSAAKEATGINENLLGQFMSGRRSATEARNVSNNSASRLILTIFGIWGVGIVPQGRRMLSNLRSGLDVPQLVRIYGETRLMVDTASSQMTDPSGQNALSRFLPVSKAELTGNYDFEVFDGTLPSQRGAVVQVLREVLIAMAGNPSSIPVFGMDPTLLFTEILELSDVRNVNRLRLTPERLQQLVLMVSPPSNAGATEPSKQPAK